MRGKSILDGKQTSETPTEGFASTCRVLVVGLFALTFVFQNFVIPSSSMASTLLVGDHVVVERETLAPPLKWAPFLHYREVQRHDIVVFYKPTQELNGGHIFLVKRVIGIPGDHIHLRNGIVYLNGVAQDEPQAAKPTRANYDPYVNDFPSVDPATEPDVTPEWSASLAKHVQGEDLVVPPGHYFVMGDNRTNSRDSRAWGFVPRENILGRPLFVYWSIETPESGMEDVPLKDQASSTLHEFIHFFDQTRWKRTFHPIR
jgi:signal peptidase I